MARVSVVGFKRELVVTVVLTDDVDLPVIHMHIRLVQRGVVMRAHLDALPAGLVVIRDPRHVVRDLTRVIRRVRRRLSPITDDAVPVVTGGSPTLTISDRVSANPHRSIRTAATSDNVSDDALEASRQLRLNVTRGVVGGCSVQRLAVVSSANRVQVTIRGDHVDRHLVSTSLVQLVNGLPRRNDVRLPSNPVSGRTVRQDTMLVVPRRVHVARSVTSNGRSTGDVSRTVPSGSVSRSPHLVNVLKRRLEWNRLVVVVRAITGSASAVRTPRPNITSISDRVHHCAVAATGKEVGEHQSTEVRRSTNGRSSCRRPTNERNSIRPTLDVNGIWGGYTGEGSKTVIPSQAFAKISMRLVPNQDWEKISALFAKHFTAIAPKGVKVEVTTHHGGQSYVTPIDHVGYRAAAAAYQDTFGVAPIPQRGGGSIPIVALFETELDSKTILMGFGLDSDAIHSPNEHFGVWNYFKGIETIPRFFHHFAELSKE